MLPVTSSQPPPIFPFRCAESDPLGSQGLQISELYVVEGKEGSKRKTVIGRLEVFDTRRTCEVVREASMGNTRLRVLIRDSESVLLGRL